MQEVQPVDAPAARQTSLPFPYNMRFSMAFWNALFLDPKPFAPDPSQSAEWNRGKYLVDGAAHCGECHTPRGFLMQQKHSQEFGGAVIGSWYAPNITPSTISGIGAMSADELFRYLMPWSPTCAACRRSLTRTPSRSSRRASHSMALHRSAASVV
jgi:mono/diheme cytochrome c family protein